MRSATASSPRRRTLRDDQHELIAPQACDGVDFAHHAFEALRDISQQFVPDPVSEGIVDQL